MDEVTDYDMLILRQAVESYEKELRESGFMIHPGFEGRRILRKIEKMRERDCE